MNMIMPLTNHVDFRFLFEDVFSAQYGSLAKERKGELFGLGID